MEQEDRALTATRRWTALLDGAVVFAEARHRRDQGALGPHARPGVSRSAARRIFPLGVRGSAAAKSTMRGYL